MVRTVSDETTTETGEEEECPEEPTCPVFPEPEGPDPETYPADKDLTSWLTGGTLLPSDTDGVTQLLRKILEVLIQVLCGVLGVQPPDGSTQTAPVFKCGKVDVPAGETVIIDAKADGGAPWQWFNLWSSLTSPGNLAAADLLLISLETDPEANAENCQQVMLCAQHNISLGSSRICRVAIKNTSDKDALVCWNAGCFGDVQVVPAEPEPPLPPPDPAP